jgi:chemotaxis signal transduction protein
VSDERRPSALESLRAEFDASFAAAPAAAPPARVALLAVRAGGEPVAVRVLETTGLLRARPVVAVPSARTELLGVCGVRGAVLPVYSVARLLRGAEDGGAPRWMVLAGPADRPVALAFAELEGHLLVTTDELHRAEPGEVALSHVAELVRRGERAIPVASVPSMLRAITGA